MMDDIRASIVDGIALNARFRERTLVALHRAIETFRTPLLEALLDDKSATTTSEAHAQYRLTLDAIRQFHSTVDPKESLKQEYKPAKSSDDADKRIPYGYAHIVPSDNHALYTTVVAVAAAVAAGNCVVIEQDMQLSGTHKLIRELLTGSISSEVLLYMTKDPFDPEFQRKHRISVQSESLPGSIGESRSLDTPPRLRAAIVDRSADIQAAAQACVFARFGFAGSSAYAPDVVLVNEYFIDSFSAAAQNAALPFLTSQSKGHVEKKPNSIQGQGTFLAKGERGSIVLLKKDNKQALLHEPSATLKILPVSSGEACIDLLNKQDQPLLINYVFADPRTAKYLSQFIRSSISIINHISPALLVGPAAPDGFTTSIHPRYTPDMFSMASPVLIECPTVDVAALIWPKDNTKTGSLESWLDTTIQPVKEGFGPKVGFFEQGLLFGVGVILSSTIVCCTFAVRYGYPVVARVIARQW